MSVNRAGSKYTSCSSLAHCFTAQSCNHHNPSIERLFIAPMNKSTPWKRSSPVLSSLFLARDEGGKYSPFHFFSSYSRKDFYVIPSDFHSFGGIQPSERKWQRTENVAALGGRGGKIIPLSVRLHLSEEAGVCFLCISLLLPDRRRLFLLLYTCTAGTAVNNISMKRAADIEAMQQHGRI